MRSVDMMRDAFKAFSQKHHTYLSPVACHFFLAAPASIPAARSMISKLAARTFDYEPFDHGLIIKKISCNCISLELDETKFNELEYFFISG